ncbi:hypothetical protein [Brevibacterium yomogidense]|uniref:hypothetical protein n=1 Tax=Brevibacterium yomogidense TaxID=946573 RepID=UPI0018E04AD7|nr:hypothetical protein [Brevibacterium yomogidense]
MSVLRVLAAVACVLGLVAPGAAAWATPLTDQPAAQSTHAATGVVVIGAAGLTQSDLSPDRTPHLWSAVEDGAVANLSVRTLTPATCAAAGWLSLGAGARMHSVDLTPDWFSPLLAHTSCPRMIDPIPDAATAVDDDTEAEVPGPAVEAPGTAGTPLEAGPATFEDFDRVLTANEGAGYGAAPGAFTRPTTGAVQDATARSAGDDSDAGADEATPADGSDGTAPADGSWCTAAYGRGAAYAAADADGHVPTWAPATSLYMDPAATSATDGADGTEASTGRTDGTGGDDETVLDSCALTLIDAGTAADPTWEPNAWHAWNDESLGRTRTGQIAALDARVGRILAQTPETSDVIIAGVGDADYPSRLRALIAVGPSYEPGTLRSSSTRQPGLVQLTDVLPAAIGAVELEAAGTSPAQFVVDPSDDAEARMDRLVADSRKAGTVHTHAQTFSIFLDVVHYTLTLALAVLLLSSVVRVLRTRAPRTFPALRRWGTWVCFTIGLIPMGSFLAGILPWGRAPNPAWGLVGAITVGTLALVGLSVAGPWRRTWQGRIAAVSLVTAAVLVVDVALGSRLQFNALMGYNPIVAGRFYGLGNQGAALFLAAALLGLGIVAARLLDTGRTIAARVLVAGFATASVFVLGNPAWGAKFGGTVAALVGFTVLLLSLFRIRVSIVRLALIGAGALAIIVGVAGLDYLRPPAARSHFGNFFAQALDGQLIEVISRKLEANLRIIVINPGLAVVVPLAVFTVLFSLAYLRRFERTALLARPWEDTLPKALTHPTVHAGFLSAAIALGVGLVITDSGVAVPATGAMMLVPMLVVMSIGVVREDGAVHEDGSVNEDGPLREDEPERKPLPTDSEAAR